MIERKAVKHVISSDAGRFHSILMLDESYCYAPSVPVVRTDIEERNEEAIRRKLYGDVVDELLRIRQEIRSGPLDPRVWAVERIGLLIDKLEWKHG